MDCSANTPPVYNQWSVVDLQACFTWKIYQNRVCRSLFVLNSKNKWFPHSKGHRHTPEAVVFFVFWCFGRQQNLSQHFTRFLTLVSKACLRCEIASLFLIALKKHFYTFLYKSCGEVGCLPVKLTINKP